MISYYLGSTLNVSVGEESPKETKMNRMMMKLFRLENRGGFNQRIMYLKLLRSFDSTSGRSSSGSICKVDRRWCIDDDSYPFTMFQSFHFIAHSLSRINYQHCLNCLVTHSLCMEKLSERSRSEFASRYHYCRPNVFAISRKPPFPWSKSIHRSTQPSSLAFCTSSFDHDSSLSRSRYIA